MGTVSSARRAESWLRIPAPSDLPPRGPLPEPSVGTAEQSNSAVIFGDRYLLKLFRKLEPGLNPDLEIGRYLTGRAFPHVPAIAGALEYQRPNSEPVSLAILTQFVANSKDAWEYTLDALSRYYERVQSNTDESLTAIPTEGSLLALLAQPDPTGVTQLVGTYAESARLLGERTAQLHAVLSAGDHDDKSLSPEPFSPHYQRSLYQSMRNITAENLQLLKKRLPHLPTDVKGLAEKVIGLEKDILLRFRAIYETPINALRVRTHGDFHLGQVLYTGKDFQIIDFEGEPARALSERRIKRSPLRDVAGMLRSFHYAAYSALFKMVEKGAVTPERFAGMEHWARFWQVRVSVIYFRAYLEEGRKSAYLPKTDKELAVMMKAYLLDKGLYELGYELNNRPTWVKIPLLGILQLMEETQ